MTVTGETPPCSGEVDCEGGGGDPGADATVRAAAEHDATATHPANASTAAAAAADAGILSYAAAAVSRFMPRREIRIPQFSPPPPPFPVRTAIFPFFFFRKLSPRSDRAAGASSGHRRFSCKSAAEMCQ